MNMQRPLFCIVVLTCALTGCAAYQKCGLEGCSGDVAVVNDIAVNND
jgi:hypothetical protein